MDLFPVMSADIPRQAVTDIGRAPAFDLAARAFPTIDGALAETSGSDAVRRWITLMLRQQPGGVAIYRTEGQTMPGIDRSLLSQRTLPVAYVAAEIERNIRDTLTFCPAVRTSDNYTFTRTRRGLAITFTVYLYTEETLEVRTDVNSE